MKLVKLLRQRPGVFGRSPHVTRRTKISLGLITAVFLLQFYYIRELLSAEVVLLALGFVAVALIGAIYALGCIAALCLQKLGSGLKALGAFVSAKHQQPFTKATNRSLFEAKEEVP